MHFYFTYSIEFTSNNQAYLSSAEGIRTIVNFRDNINYETIINYPNTMKNEQVSQYFQMTIRRHLPVVMLESSINLPQNKINTYYSEFDIGGIIVKILFFEYENLEFITKDVIKNNPTIGSTIHRDFKTFNYVYTNDREQFKYKIQNVIRHLEADRFLNLTQPDFIAPLIKTRLFKHQIDNINWMIETESNLNNYIVHSKLIRLGDGRIYRYEENDFVTDETLPKLQIRGGVICDQIGTGKSLQFVCMAVSNPSVRTVVLVPNHLKTHWENQFELHLKIPIPDYVKIMTFDEFKAFPNVECDRLMVDELHELYSKPENSHAFMKAVTNQARFKWGLTATPFTVEYSISNIFRFLTATYFSQDQIQGYQYNYPVLYNIFRKNTSNIIKDEIQLPPMSINNLMIKFTPREMAVYQAEIQAGENLDVNVLRKICCDVLISIAKEEVSIKYENFSTLVQQNYQEKYDIELGKLMEYRKMLDNVTETWNNTGRVNEEYLKTMVHLQNQIEKQTIITANKKKSLDFINDHFSNVPTCPICLSDIDINSDCAIIAKENCNHYFCSSCLRLLIMDANRSGHFLSCQMCRNAFSEEHVKYINTEDEQPKYPSKINKLIELIHSTPDKIIVYSQFDSLIEKLRIILEKEQINSVIYKDHSDIITARDDPTVRVIILSSNKNASGLDLTFINKIVIFEPFIGNFSYLRDVEKQIIGRIYRINQQNQTTVYRLIIESTIEEEIYNQLAVHDM